MQKLIFSAFLFLFCATAAFAHRVNIFAWVDGNAVRVQVGFSKSQPAKEAVLQIISLRTEQPLLTGQTNEKGQFSFSIPSIAKDEGLLIKVQAGAGHQNSWSMPPQEFGGKEEEVKESSVVQKEVSSVDTVVLRAMIREEMSNQLAPIRKILAEMQVDEPKITEIIGGIGWLIGMSGLYFAYRSKKKC
ncbi:MAG: hypothetical protein IK079_02055 [Desulfovibrio sp.]|nr:hypothetical protein [Desulfovibrio sp.]